MPKGTQKGLMSYAFRFFMIAAGLMVLLTAIPIYAVVEVIACLRGRRTLTAATLGTRLSAAAPWLPVLTLLLFAGFLAVFAARVFATLDENKFLAFVGTVPSSLRWGFRHRLAWRCGCRVDGCRHTCLVETAPAYLGGEDLLQLAFSRRVGGDNGTLAGRLAGRAISLESSFRLLKKTHMLRCARPISRQRTRRVRLRSSIFALKAGFSVLELKFAK